MNDLVHIIKHSSLSAYAHDTQIFYADKEPAEIEETINNDLARVDIWYEENGMKRNPAKYQAIVMGKTQIKPQFYCENTEIPIGVTVDDKLKFDKHVAKVCRKVSRQVAVLKRMKKMLPFETRKSIYFCIYYSPFQLLLRDLALLQ